ncbi:ankyrin repeat-containing domain protein [Pseudomassariella vexata]|uniref:Ankyrin repeat-containing domain protein n=1 Tax=Pseudomassariella vexata TaxID=1141098 RepID=A0A1Y2E9Q1_9PEZI|nr:ankyrin repeat-containing domain protein [Pseudomassariella vexata]ORY68318.1 ankyrin repeat-containing domain protein [Pseudomassariella vexata]
MHLWQTQGSTVETIRTTMQEQHGFEARLCVTYCDSLITTKVKIIAVICLLEGSELIDQRYRDVEGGMVGTSVLINTLLMQVPEGVTSRLHTQQNTHDGSAQVDVDLQLSSGGAMRSTELPGNEIVADNPLDNLLVDMGDANALDIDLSASHPEGMPASGSNLLPLSPSTMAKFMGDGLGPMSDDGAVGLSFANPVDEIEVTNQRESGQMFEVEQGALSPLFALTPFEHTQSPGANFSFSPFQSGVAGVNEFLRSIPISGLLNGLPLSPLVSSVNFNMSSGTFLARLKPFRNLKLLRISTLDFLQETGNVFSQALAENLFRAAIEACEPQVVRALLKTSLVDVNAIVCTEFIDKSHDFGQPMQVRRTPIERAAALRHIEMTECLLDADADVNKTYVVEHWKSEYDALECALGIWPKCGEIDIKLVKLLLDHGAEVSVRILETVIFCRNEDLIVAVLSKFSPSWHAKLFEKKHESSCLLVNIIIHIPNELANKVVHWTIQACQSTNCNQCMDDRKEPIKDATVAAAKRGNLQLIELLLTYAFLDGLDGVLAAAVRSGSRALVEYLLNKGVNIDAPPCCINLERHLPNTYTTPLTTPLAEAIRTGNDVLINRFEEGGTLARLEEDDRFEFSLLAATEVGNAPYLQKLLQMVPHPTQSALMQAFRRAMHDKHEDIALILLAAGAYTNRLSLKKALKMKSRRMFSAILECNPDIHYGYDATFGTVLDKSCGIDEDAKDCVIGSHIFKPVLLEMASAWGELSIVQDLIFIGADLNAFTHAPALSVAIQTGNEPLIKLLIYSGADVNAGFDYPLGATNTIVSPLAAAVSVQDSSLIHSLLNRGADPANTGALIGALNAPGEVLSIMLRNFCQRYPNGRTGFGGTVLLSALKIHSAAVLDLCLGAKLDVNSFIYDDRSELNGLENVTFFGFVIREYGCSHLDLVKKLLDAGGDINGPASLRARYEAVRTLPPPNFFSIIRNKGTQTAFLESIQTKSLSLVELLIQRGADVQKAARLGLKHTPLQKACEVGSLQIVELLLQHGADVNAPPAFSQGATALQLAAKIGSIQMAQRLLGCGAHVHAPKGQVDGYSALEFAAKYGRFGMISFLAKKADPAFTAKDYDEAVVRAQEEGHLACVSVLQELKHSSQEYIGFDC